MNRLSAPLLGVRVDHSMAWALRTWSNNILTEVHGQIVRDCEMIFVGFGGS